MPLTKERNVTVPSRLIKNLVEHSNELLSAHEQLEDFLIAKNKKLVRSLKQARREQLRGETIPLKSLKRAYGV